MWYVLPTMTSIKIWSKKNLRDRRFLLWLEEDQAGAAQQPAVLIQVGLDHMDERDDVGEHLGLDPHLHVLDEAGDLQRDASAEDDDVRIDEGVDDRDGIGQKFLGVIDDLHGRFVAAFRQLVDLAGVGGVNTCQISN